MREDEQRRLNVIIVIVAFGIMGWAYKRYRMKPSVGPIPSVTIPTAPAL